jgi:hypothetical protein
VQEKPTLKQKTNEYQKAEAQSQIEIFALEAELENLLDWQDPQHKDSPFLAVFRGTHARFFMKKHKVRDNTSLRSSRW